MLIFKLSYPFITVSYAVERFVKKKKLQSGSSPATVKVNVKFKKVMNWFMSAIRLSSPLIIVKFSTTVNGNT